jgi:hypothetical protein
MHPRAAIGGLLVALLAGCGGGGEPPPELPPRSHPEAVADAFFGINGQALRPLADDGKLDLLDAQLDRLATGGIGFVRANIDWTRVEPKAPTADGRGYEFAGLDAWMRALAEHGLRWQLQVVGVPTPAWAADPAALSACGSRAAPARATDVAALAGALAHRYGRGGSFWKRNPDLAYTPVDQYELWNEENYGAFWCPVPDPAAYARLTRLATATIQALDPRAAIVLGGLAGFRETRVTAPGAGAHMSSTEFLRRMLAAEPQLARQIDVVGVHAYGHDAADALATVAYQRQAVDASALRGKPLSVNEIGWYTDGTGPDVTDEATRARYLAELTHALAASDCGIASLAPHTWISAESNPANPDDWYGIADPAGGEPYDSGRAYTDQVLLFEGRTDQPPPAGRTRICG